MSGFKIELSPGATGTKVWIDGVQQIHLVDIVIRHKAGEVPVLELTHLLTEDIVVDGEADVKQITICPACKASQL